MLAFAGQRMVSPDDWRVVWRMSPVRPVLITVSAAGQGCGVACRSLDVVCWPCGSEVMVAAEGPAGPVSRFSGSVFGWFAVERRRR